MINRFNKPRDKGWPFMPDELPMPELIRAANCLPYDYADGAGIDYEPFDAFLSPADTEYWLRAWTGNSAADASNFSVFGQDGSGGFVAVWKVRMNADLLQQPVVFLGSEGERAVIASNFHDYLWLLAAGLGPSEAASNPDVPGMVQSPLADFAATHAGPVKAFFDRVLADAQTAFPDFSDWIDGQCT
jgi:hypothetical protein